MDLITRTELEQLAGADGGTHVSLYLPTHRGGQEAEGDRLRFKNQLHAVEAALEKSGRSQQDVRRLLAPARDLLDDGMAWTAMSDGLAVFLTDDGMRSYRLVLDLPELAAVGDSFVLSPLLPLLADEQFLALTLSQKQVRVLRGSRSSVDQLQIPGVPGSFDDVYEADHEPRSDKSPRPAPSGSMVGGGAVFHGAGVWDNAHQKEMLEFFREVADGVQHGLGGRTLPMVLVGLTEWISTYRSVNRYPHVLDRAVERNPDDLTAQQVHDAAWPIIEERLREQGQGAFARLQQQRGVGAEGTSPEKALVAAEEGRVDTLLLDRDGCWGSGNGSDVVVLGSGRPHPCEVLDAAAAATLRTGGTVRVLDALPEGMSVGAVLRY